MRIAAVETLCLSRLHEPERQWVTATMRIIKADAALVRIVTDTGLVGIGEASPYGWPLQIRSWVEWLTPELLGQEPARPDLAPRPNGRNWAHDAAAAAIDVALWDLRAQSEGRRVCQLLATDPADGVRLYASSGCRYDWRHNPEQLVGEVRQAIADGFTAYKFRIGTDWTWDGVTVDRFLGLVREVAAEVNGRIELMLDGNSRLTEEQALAIALELDRLGFVWFEEPIPAAQIDGYQRLCQAVGMAISGGECFTTLEQFRPYLERRAYDIVQPDVALCGLTEAMRIARMADRYGVDVCPHSWHNGLMAVENAHFVAALPRPRVLELCLIQGPLQWAVLAQPPDLTDGWLHFTDRPGLGVELAEGLEAQFPHVEGHYALTVQR